MSGMKKTIAGVIGLACLLQQTAIFAASPLEGAILSVKGRIDIPEALTEFESASTTGEDGKTYYRLDWSNKEETKSLEVMTDEKGRITGVYQYDEDWYAQDDVLTLDENAYDGAMKFADQWIKKVAPEQFTEENDQLVRQQPTEKLNLRDMTYTFVYDRIRNGYEVAENDAYVNVRKAGDGFAVYSADLNWDYDADFKDADKLLTKEEAQKAYETVFPIEMQYRRYDKKTVFLEYQTGGRRYIDAETGEKAEPKPHDVMPLGDRANQEKSAATMDAGAGGLSPREQQEVDAVAGLKTADEIFSAVKKIPELSVPSDLTVRSKQIYKTEDGYQIRLYYSNAKDDQAEDESTSLNLTADAETGKILSYNRYDSNWQEEKTQNPEKADAFLKAYYPAEYAACRKVEEQNEGEEKIVRPWVNYQRIVNGALYPENGLYAYYNTAKGYITTFYCTWDSDTSYFPDAKKAKTPEDAYALIFEKYPLKMIYLETENGYRPVWTLSESWIQLDAISGKFTEYDGKEVDDFKPAYTDLSGHWAEQIVNQLANYGVAIRSEKFMPDQEITQAEYLTLLCEAMYPYDDFREEDYVYETMLRRKVLTADEKNPNGTITKETAICYLLRVMGMQKVAELPGIYRCDFSDESEITPALYGYCALAKGFGIVNGANQQLQPQKTATRAEAVTLIYQYLTK